MSEFVAIPAVVVICWFIGLCMKKLINSDKVDKFIPCVCGLLGGILGLVIFFTTPDLIAADSWFGALATGIVSGLSATGLDQIKKQLTK